MMMIINSTPASGDAGVRPSTFRSGEKGTNTGWLARAILDGSAIEHPADSEAATMPMLGAAGRLASTLSAAMVRGPPCLPIPRPERNR